MLLELTTPQCRCEEVDNLGVFLRVLFEANELPKFWRPQRDDTVVVAGVAYEIKDIVANFDIQEGTVDPSGGQTQDKLEANLTIAVTLK